MYFDADFRISAALRAALMVTSKIWYFLQQRCTWSKFSRGLTHGWEYPKLLHQTQEILVRPVLHCLAVSPARHVNPCYRYLLAGWWRYCDER